MAKKLTSEQQRVLSAFIAEGKRQGATYKQMKALVEAGLVESSLRNLNYGDRDSIGSLQQRNSWGSREARLNPTLAARKFLQQAKNAHGGTSGQLAQAVQRSAFPGRYDQRGGEAASLLRGFQGGGGGPVAPAQSGAPDRQALARFLLSGGADNPNAVMQLAAARQMGGAESVSKPSSRPSGGKGRGSLIEAFYDPIGGIKRGKEIGAIGGHSDHVHVAVAHSELPRIEALAKKMGLSITSTTGGKHVAGSYHYKKMAADVAGDPAAMARFYKSVKKMYGVR